MKILLDIKNNKATHLMAVLKELPYVKTQELTPANARVLKELKEAVDNMILVTCFSSIKMEEIFFVLSRNGKHINKFPILHKVIYQFT